MTATTRDDPSQSSPSSPGRRRRFLPTILGLLALLLAAAAVTPTALAPIVARRLSAATGADVRIGWISWNPLGGRVSLHRVAVAPGGGQPAIMTALDLTLDVAVRSWLRGERRLDAVVLRRPWVALRRTAPGDFDVASLFPALTAKAETPAASAATSAGPPTPIRIGLFRVISGSIEFRDETITPALETSLHLDDASARDLVVASDGSAGLAFHVESRLDEEPLTLDVRYDTGIDSSHLTAALVAANASLARALLYVPLGWQRTSGTMDATITYERTVTKHVLQKHGVKADLTVHDLSLTEPWAKEPMLVAKRVRVPALAVDLVKQQSDLGAISVDDYRALVLRDDERLHVPLATGSAETTAASPWKTTLDRVALGQGTATLRNVLATSEVTVPVTHGTIRLPQNEVAFSFAGTLAGGRVTLDGRSNPTTTALSFGLGGLDLVAAAPLAGLPLAFAKGTIEGVVELTLSEASQTFHGNLRLLDASTAPDAPHPEEVLAWQALDLAIAESTLEPLRVHVSSAAAIWPYVMVHRRSDGIFPFRLANTPTNAPSPEAAAPSTPWLQLDHLIVKGGRIEFYDSTLPKAYGIDLTDLTASAEAITLGPPRARQVSVDGKLDELSPVTITGTIAPTGTVLEANIDRLLLPPLNPYLAPALGYEVKTGLARVASDIRLDGSRVKADTDLVLSRFAMRAAGTDTVEARIGTPLSVALALMKDTRGDIHLDLPIEGDVASSEYRVGSLLREALGTALLGTIRGPLGFLRGIFRKDEGEQFDLRPVPFPAGSAALGPDGEARIAEIARLLNRQTALEALLIPAPSRADFDAVKAGGATQPLDTLAQLARDRGAAVYARLTGAQGIDAARVSVETWDPVEPDIEGDPGVDVQLRAD
jgi:hypothetical protein